MVSEIKPEQAPKRRSGPQAALASALRPPTCRAVPGAEFCRPGFWVIQRGTRQVLDIGTPIEPEYSVAVAGLEVAMGEVSLKP